ncbi:hypothetical protein KC345_g8822 [Hortaea werneckii]|nr:hypothetical protein KC345_g8822 [Hortaea werneckii]
MSGFFRPRNLAIAAGGLGAAVVFFPTSTPGNVFETPGVRNIGARYSAGGASDTHVPGAATKRGDPSSKEAPNETPTGVDTPFFQERQAEQKVGTSGKLGSAYHAAHYGEPNSKGK